MVVLLQNQDNWFGSQKDYKVVNSLHVESPNCHSQNCTLNYDFNWVGEGDCQASFLCNNIDDSLCVDYGISLKFDGKLQVPSHGLDQDFIPVCKEDYAYLGLIPMGGAVKLRIRFSDPAFYQSNCYVWCLDQDSKPKVKYAVSPSQNLFRSLVSPQLYYLPVK